MKNTKDTALNTTETPSQKSGSPTTTEKLSAASKNISKGLWAEQVVRQNLEKKFYQLMAQRYQIQGVEIDLIFKKDHDWLLVEVKYLDNIWRAGERVSQKQIQRLKKVESYLKFNKNIKSVVFLIALVEKNKNIHWIHLTDY